MAKNCKCLKHNSVGAKMMQETKRVKNPRKQRKMLFNAPAHVRHKLMAAPLSKELAASRGAKTLPVRKGDTVRIQRGDNKGFEGKVSRVAPKEYRIYIEGLTREKVDGTNIFISVHPSKVMIRNLNLDDNWRKQILGRKKEIEKPKKEEKAKAKPAKKAEKAPEKPKAKVEEVKEEKPVEAPPVEEKAVSEVAKEQVPAEKVPEKVAEKAPEKAPAAKKAVAKKPAAKKPAAKKEVATEKKKPAKAAAPVEEEKTPAKKAAKPRTAAKKTAASKEAPAKETAAKKTAPKPRAKRKTSEQTEGGQ
jgi:large subunit ribosomal protein L24